MAKKKKLTTKPTPPKPPIVQQSEESTVPATTPSNEPPVKEGRKQKFIQRLRDSFVDWVLDNFWTGVFLGMAAVATLIWLYMSGGGSAWVYPYLNFALGFLAACLTLVFVSLSFSYIKARRLRQAKSLEFVSHKKGFLDHAVNLERAVKEFQGVLTDIGREISRSGTASGRIGQRLEAAGNNRRVAHRAVTRGAATLNKHAERMEKFLSRFEEIANLLFESSVGYIERVNPASKGNKEPLVATRQSLENLIELMRNSIETSSTYRDACLAVKEENVAQAVDSAINRLVHVTNGILSALEESENHWKDLIGIIDGKLNS